MINTCMPAFGPHIWSSWNGTCDIAPASCFGPRRASDHHDAGRYGQRPLPSRTVLPSCTPHTEGAPQGTASWLSAKQVRNLCSLRTAPLPDAVLHVPCSISFPLGSVWGTPVVHRDDRVFSAYILPPVKKAPRAELSVRHILVFTDYTLSQRQGAYLCSKVLIWGGFKKSL